MRPYLKTVYIATLFCLPLAARAQEIDTTKPSPAYFLGHWDCSGMVFEPHGADIVDVVGTWHFHHGASDWVTDAFEFYAGNGSHYAEWGWSKYDRHDHTYVRHAANTWGGYGRYETNGWRDGTWIWAGEARGLSADTSPVVETITKKGADHFWISVRFFDLQKNRHDLYKADCRRQAAPKQADTCFAK